MKRPGGRLLLLSCLLLAAGAYHPPLLAYLDAHSSYQLQGQENEQKAALEQALKAGKLTQADQLISSFIAQQPEYLERARWIVYLVLELGDSALSEAAGVRPEAYRSLELKWLRQLTRFKQAQAQDYQLLAQAMFQSAEPAELQSIVAAALALQPDPLTRFELQALLSEHAFFKAQRPQALKAFEDLLQALRALPTASPEAAARPAQASELLYLGRVKETLSSVQEQAYDNFPDDEQVLEQILRSQQQLTRWQVSWVPSYAPVYFELAEDQKQRGQQTEALASYGKAISLEPENPLYYYGRALYYQELGQAEAALADLSKLIEIFEAFSAQRELKSFELSSLVRYYRLRAEIFESLGKCKEASADRAQACELSGQDCQPSACQ